MTVRIMHAADLHLGRPFSQLGDVGPARGSDLFETFERICTEALDHEVVALLLAGDLFDTFAPTADVVGRVQGQLERLTRAGMNVFVVPGDADSATYERSIWRRQAFEGVHVFLAPTFETQSFEVDDTTVHVHGIAFDGAAHAEPMSTLQAEAPGIHIALLHATIDEPHAPAAADEYFPVKSAELFAGGVSYVALGHRHNRQQILSRHGFPACYPGSPEGLETDEIGARYVALVEFEDGAPDISWLEVNRRQIVNTTVDTTDLGLDDVVEDLLELSGEDVMLTVLLTGIPREMLDEQELHDAVADRCFWIELRDETMLSASPFATSIAGENTIRGHFVRTLQRRIGGTRDVEERAALEGALKLGLRALQRSSAA
jgi:DNA repair protein SbcD/Mre11